jgi:hypothetical protein
MLLAVALFACDPGPGGRAGSSGGNGGTGGAGAEAPASGGGGSGGTVGAAGAVICSAEDSGLSCGTPGVVFCNDFDDDPVGVYTVDNLYADFNVPVWENGVSAGFDSIVGAPEACRGQSFRVHYPAGKNSPEGASDWPVLLPNTYDELYCAYRVKFAEGFEFTEGGKLPGLCGGTCNSDAVFPTGTDGFSARMMWRSGGSAVQLVYYVDQEFIYGDDFPYDLGGQQRRFIPGQWHRVEHHIVMNTPGAADGIVEAWFDGVKALERKDIQFRSAAGRFGIDTLYFCTFFGGDWSATKDEYAYFDDIIVSTEPIAH